MRIASLFIQNYGSIQNRRMPDSGNEFGHRLNLIFGPNEAGKSQIRGFVEDILFPKTSPRSGSTGKAIGEIYFEEDGTDFLLEAKARGRSVASRLVTSGGVESALSELFPALKKEGREIFANLYSFGLDQLLYSTTVGNRALSEHLFGAVAGGRGISISSIQNQLDDRIKKAIGGTARGRTLEVVYNDLVQCKREIDGYIQLELSLADKLRSKKEISDGIDTLDQQLHSRKEQLLFLEMIQSKYDHYHRYVENREFLSDHPRLIGLNLDMIRGLESDLLQMESTRGNIASIEMEIRESESVKSKLVKEISGLDPIKIDTARVQVEGLQKVSEEMVNLSQEIESASEIIDSTLDRSRGRVFELVSSVDRDSFIFDNELAKLSDVRSDIRSLEQKLSSLGVQVSDLRKDQLEVRAIEVGKSLELCKNYLNTTGRSEKQDSLLLLGLFSIVCILAAAAFVFSLSRGQAPEFKYASLSVAILAAGLLLGRVSKRSGSGNHSKGAPDFSNELNQLGIQSAGSVSLAEMITRLDQEQNKISQLIGLANELEHLAGQMKTFDLSFDLDSGFSEIKDAVTNMAGVIRLAQDRSQQIAELGQLQKRFNVEIEELRGFVSDISGQPLDPTSSLPIISATVSGLTKMVDADKICRNRLISVDEDISRLATKLGLAQQEFDNLKNRVSESIESFGWSIEDFDTDHLTLLRECFEANRQKEIFENDINELFRARADIAMSLFARGELELQNSLRELEDNISDTENQLSEARKSLMEVEFHEKRLLNENPLVDLQARRESLLLEAEGLVTTLKADSLAKELLNAANRRFEEVHQPELMQLTSLIFSRITNGRYQLVLKKKVGDKESVYVRNQRGEDLLDLQLSRGTREQLYLSIRLALITRPDSIRLPFFLDDVMVNADSERSFGLARELENISRNNQIFYFCARPESLKIFEEAGVAFELFQLDRLP